MNSHRRRGPGKKPRAVQITIRLDAQTVETFKRDGRGWQTRMRRALAFYVAMGGELGQGRRRWRNILTP